MPFFQILVLGRLLNLESTVVSLGSEEGQDTLEPRGFLAHKLERGEEVKHEILWVLTLDPLNVPIQSEAFLGFPSQNLTQKSQ